MKIPVYIIQKKRELEKTQRRDLENRIPIEPPAPAPIDEKDRPKREEHTRVIVIEM